jgi:hypothetical protein
MRSQQVSLSSYFKKEDNDTPAVSLASLNNNKQAFNPNPAVSKKKRVLPSSITSMPPAQVRRVDSEPAPPSSSMLTSSSIMKIRRDLALGSGSKSENNLNYRNKNTDSSRIDDDEAEEKKEKIDLYKQYNLSSSQKTALDAILARKSVFYTGAAGM